MRDLNKLDSFRLRTREIYNRYGSYGDSKGGAFMVPVPAQHTVLKCIASADDDWDHVSVSLPGRCPSWAEMDYIKRIFFEPGETAMQLHVPTQDHINVHPYCLHLWRPHKIDIPTPSRVYV